MKCSQTRFVQLYLYNQKWLIFKQLFIRKYQHEKFRIWSVCTYSRVVKYYNQSTHLRKVSLKQDQVTYHLETKNVPKIFYYNITWGCTLRCIDAWTLTVKQRHKNSKIIEKTLSIAVYIFIVLTHIGRGTLILHYMWNYMKDTSTTQTWFNRN